MKEDPQCCWPIGRTRCAETLERLTLKDSLRHMVQDAIRVGLQAKPEHASKCLARQVLGVVPSSAAADKFEEPGRQLASNVRPIPECGGRETSFDQSCQGPRC